MICFFIAHQNADIIPTQEETSLGQLEYQDIVSSVQNDLKKKWENIKLTAKERYDIGKCSSIHGARAAVRKIKKSHLQLDESTARSLKKNDEELVRSKSNKMVLSKMKSGLPFMLCSLEKKVKSFLWF